MTTLNIVYVCEGNEIRSPAARAVTETLAAKQGLEVIVDSMGLSARNAGFMNLDMAGALRRAEFRDITYFEVKRYTTKPVTSQLLENADYIFCMERYQVQEVLKIIPEKQGRVYTLPGFVGYDKEIKDPLDKITAEPYKRRIRFPLIKTLEKVFLMTPDSPNGIRAKILNLLGIFMSNRMGLVYGRDQTGIEQLFRNAAREIIEYVDLVLQKIFGDKYRKSDI